MQFRRGGPDDAEAVAALHADSWRNHYRGAYSDRYLDGDLVAERLEVWRNRLRGDDQSRHTIVAEEGGHLVGFVHVVIDEDPRWGSLLDNLHVYVDHKRRGVGKRLMTLAAEAVVEQGDTAGMYLWVLEQNKDAQSFYQSLGGVKVETSPVDPPGGVPDRLTGSPNKHRYAWPDPNTLTRRLRT